MHCASGQEDKEDFLYSRSWTLQDRYDSLGDEQHSCKTETVEYLGLQGSTSLVPAVHSLESGCFLKRVSSVSAC